LTYPTADLEEAIEGIFNLIIPEKLENKSMTADLLRDDVERTF